MASSREVLPWSTCPITTTTGGLSSSLDSSSSSSAPKASSMISFSSSCSRITLYSSAIEAAVSKSSVALMASILPFFIRFITRSEPFLPRTSARSFTVMLSGIYLITGSAFASSASSAASSAISAASSSISRLLRSMGFSLTF